MFEGFTLGEQREVEAARGWKPSYGALTYCTAEAVVVYRANPDDHVLDWEILDAERVTGAPDCVGKRQGKWGTYIMPGKDKSAVEAVRRCLNENFGEAFGGELLPARIIGPWLHKATVHGTDLSGRILQVHPEQGEQTPFEAKLFAFDAYSKNFDASGGHAKATSGVRWVRLETLMAEQGENPNYLYWLMIREAVNKLLKRSRYDLQVGYVAPGDYPFIS